MSKVFKIKVSMDGMSKAKVKAIAFWVLWITMALMAASLYFF
jgi:hypothetical protein